VLGLRHGLSCSTTGPILLYTFFGITSLWLMRFPTNKRCSLWMLDALRRLTEASKALIDTGNCQHSLHHQQPEFWRHRLRQELACT
jgi:hypothetical protein